MIKKITLFITVFLITINFAKAQNWGGGIDEERFNWGFSFQYIVSEYKLVKSKDWRTPYFDEEQGKYITDPLETLHSPTSPGFGIGFCFSIWTIIYDLNVKICL